MRIAFVLKLVLVVLFCSACPSGTPVTSLSGPTRVTLFPPYERTLNSLLIAWSANQDSDFASYTVLRSDNPDITVENAETLGEFSDANNVSHLDRLLEPGTTYYYRILVTNRSGRTILSNEIRTSTLSPDEAPLEAPSPVFLSPLYESTTDSITMVWSMNENSDFAHYKLLRSDSPDLTEESAETAAQFDDQTATSHTDSSLRAGATYYYRVLVADSEGLTSLSNEISATTAQEPDPSRPEPVLLYSPVSVTADSVSLAWSVNDEADFASYTLLRSESPEVSVETADELVQPTSRELVSHVDSGLEPITAYYYRVVVTNTAGLSSLSNEVTVTTADPDNLPTAVTLHPALATSSTIELVWSTNYDTDFESYTVFRGDTAGVTQLTGTPLVLITDFDSIAYVDSDLPPETEYYYRILVRDRDNLEVLSNEIRATTLPLGAPEPVSLYPPVERTMTSALLAWSVSLDPNFTSYTLLRGTEPDVTFLTGTAAVVYADAEQVSFDDTDLSADSTYFYRVQVTNGDGLTSLSNEVEVKTLNVPDPDYPAPVSLYPPVDRAMTSISLVWSVNHDDDFESYTLLRGDAPGVTAEAGELLVVSTDSAEVAHTDSDLTPDTTYHYRVLVTDQDGFTSLSNELSVTTLAIPEPEAPTRVSLYPPVELTMTSISLAWSINYDDNFSSYTLLRSDDPEVAEEDGEVIVVKDDFEDVTHEDIGHDPAQTRYYRVLVTNGDGLSTLSNEIMATTMSLPDPEAPSPVSLYPPVEVTETSVSLAWSLSSDDDFAKYTVLRGDAPGVDSDTGTPLAEYTSAFLVNHTDTERPNGSTYYYRIMVTDDEGLSTLSNEVQATTLVPPDPVPPTAVTLLPPYGATEDTLTLNWTVNYDDDFRQYTLLADIESIPDADSGTSIRETTDRNAVLYQDFDLIPETDYYYRVVSENSLGLTTLSNEVMGTTLAVAAPAVPTPVTLGAVYNITNDSLSVSWTESPDDDFASYELYRSETPDVTTDDVLVSDTDLRTETSAVDSPLVVYTEYFYRVWVTNDVGQSIASNEVSGVTRFDAPPAPILLQDPTNVTATEMDLAWELSPALDFGNYSLYRSEDPSVDESDTLVYATPDQNSLVFADSDLSFNTTYYYRLFVEDVWGISTGSNTVSATTLNSEAPRCDISESHNWRPVGFSFGFGAVNCIDDGPLGEVQIRWNFGDGSGTSGYTDYNVGETHTYATRGAYWVTLEVFDGTFTTQTRTPVVVQDLVSIDAGTFTMGVPVDSGPWLDAEPPRTVTMSAYNVAQFEVTVDDYAAFLSDGNSPQYWVLQEIWDNHDGTYRAKTGAGQWPITSASWFDAVAFCEWAGMALPTEAQWEYAARGPSTGPNYHWPWGNTLPIGIDPLPLNFAEFVGWLADVGSYPNGATAWDGGRPIYDMAGNALEWVSDTYHPDYYQWANDNGDNNNPTGPTTAGFPADELLYKGQRGGSFHSDDNPIRVYWRSAHDDPLVHRNDYGFRCVFNGSP